MKSKYVLDMVHHNPGEPRYDSRYNDPAVLKAMGYNGKVYSLFESPVLAVDWNAVEPGLFNGESEAWREELAGRLKREFQNCKKQGLSVFAMSDMVLFPKKLVEKYGEGATFGDVSNPFSIKYLKVLIDLIFTQFPEMDGLVVRIGETYLHDAPYHVGLIKDKCDAQKTIAPLVRLLRDEICVKHDKELIFRTWAAFDEDLDAYLHVSEAVQPHEKLTIAIKHCEQDFHRGNRFSRIIGHGGHKQLIEVQCSREYEGKGAYPNYLAHGIIHGFEEHKADGLPSIGEFVKNKPELFAGIWTWTRGGGWEGPYIDNEFWPDLNAWILAQWSLDTTKTEKELFNDYATARMNLTPVDADRFHELCLLSEKAIIRGKNTLLGKLNPWWSRDEYIGIPDLPSVEVDRFLEEKAEAVAMWKEIVRLGSEIRFPDVETGHFIQVSSQYGLCIYQIYEVVFNLKAGKYSSELIDQYDQAWENLEKLKLDPACPTLYDRALVRRLPDLTPANELVEKYRNKN
jgi:hypothetical protein